MAQSISRSFGSMLRMGSLAPARSAFGCVAGRALGVAAVAPSFRGMASTPSTSNTGEGPLDTTASSLFEMAKKQTEAQQKEAEEVVRKAMSGPFISKDSYVHSTGDIDYSPQKLNMLARQIKGLPLKDAIAQMRFSVKKPARVLVRTLNQIIHNTKQIDFGHPKKPGRGLVVAQAWVGKGIYKHGIIIHGRGRCGRMTKPSSHMKIMVKVSDVPLAPNRGNHWQGKGGFLPPKKEPKRVRMILEEKPIYNKWKRLFYDA